MDPRRFLPGIQWGRQTVGTVGSSFVFVIPLIWLWGGGTRCFLSMTVAVLIGDVGDIGKGGMQNFGWKRDGLDERGGLSFLLGGLLGVLS